MAAKRRSIPISPGNGEPAPPDRPKRGRPRKPVTPVTPEVAPPPPPPPPPLPEDPPEYQEGASRLTTGQLASTIERRAPTWYVDGMIASGCLTLIVGHPTAGKSTMGAWLCARAKRPAILPGCEEDFSCGLLPRLAAVGVRLERTLLLINRLWSLPTDRRDLLAALTAHQADLLWVDPIDSYCMESTENDPQGVRLSLESLAAIASTLGIPIVCARHPGKDPTNICPGSRQWFAVPREVIELRHEPGPPARRALRLRKDPYSQGTEPRTYRLEGNRGEPKRFILAESISREDAESIGALEPAERTMIEEAQELLIHLLWGGRRPASWCYAQAEAQRLKERTVREAKRRLGVVVEREGCGTDHVAYWSLPESGRLAERVRDTPLSTIINSLGGVPVTHSQSAAVTAADASASQATTVPKDSTSYLSQDKEE